MTQVKGQGWAPLLSLWWLTFKGRIRLLARRARTAGGAFSIFIGVALLGLWVASIVLRTSMVERTVEAPSVALVRLGLFAYLGFVAFSSLSFRGVYMPRPELERLFAAPVSRRSIVRFRMLRSMLMALPFTAIVALFLGPRFASPTAAALGLACTIPAASIFGQSLSLLAAKTGGVLDRWLGRVSPALLRVVGGVGVLGLFAFLSFGPGLESSDDVRFREIAERTVRRGASSEEWQDGSVLGMGDSNPGVGMLGRIEGVAGSPALRVLTFPLTPWARAIASPSVPAALPWLGVLLCLLAALFEAVARMDIDFRESSLRTSRDMEQRLARLRSGQGGAGAFGLSHKTKGWR
ncbi:MAG: putative ABC exporter domain-containing protein, partial [Planctomycetota bacterium]